MVGEKQPPIRTQSILWAIALVFGCVFLWPAMVTFNPGDWPSPNQYPHNEPAMNACGTVGAYLAYQLRHYLGDGTYTLLLFASAAALARLVRGTIDHFKERVFGVALLIACTAASAHLIWKPGAGTLPVGPGGLVGFSLGDLLRTHLDRVGTLIVLVSALVVGLLFATEGWVLRLPAALRRMTVMSGGVVGMLRGVAGLIASPQPATAARVSTDERTALLNQTSSRRRKKYKSAKQDADEATLFDEEEEDEESNAGYEGSADYEVEDEVDEAEEDDEPDGVDLVSVPVVNFPRPGASESAEPYPRQIENWRLPSVELLESPEYGFTEQQEQVVRQQAQILEQTLEEFRLDARVVEIDTGPVITMFELKLSAGIKVSQIVSLSNDIARALKAHAVRVVAPISGKNTVGIEVPNTEKETVRLRELIALAGKRASGMGLPLFLGKDAAGDVLVTDLTKMPHLLIAGTTGSGKSVCLNSVVLSMLMTKRPDHVKLIVVDPKMVEMSQFKGVPHLMCPIVTDMVRAEKILEWAATKMDERYEMLAETRVKNIAAFNRLGENEVYARLQPQNEQEKARIATHLPYIVIIIDELADLMMTSAKEVENHLSRLAQKSRAVGIHIIVATQRPEAKVVTGLIKSNLPCRICFRVASRMDSRIVLDQNGGEVLLGQGDMLFLPPGSHKLVRAQGTYLEDAEVHNVLDDLASRAEPEYHPELIRLKATGTDSGEGLRDPLFDQAVRIILESRRGSVSLLQRRLTVGYSRASRLIDQMASAGIVGDFKGSQAREVMMTLDDWNAVRAQAASDRADGYEADQDDED